MAIGYGYCHIDTAASYRNEKEVGEGIARAKKKYGVSREELFITTKVSTVEYILNTNSFGAINMHPVTFGRHAKSRFRNLASTIWTST